VAAPTIVGVGAVAAGQGDVTPAFPAAYSAVTNDTAITFTEVDNANTVTPPTGWATLSVQGVASGTVTKLTAIWRRLVAGDTAPLIVDPGNHIVARMIVINGGLTTEDPVQSTTTELVADTSVSIPGVTTTVNDTLILAAFSTGQDVNSSAGATGWANANLTGVTEQIDNWTTQGTGGGMAMATGVMPTAGSVGNTTATLSLTANFKALMVIAIKPVVSAPGRGIRRRQPKGLILR